MPAAHGFGLQVSAQRLDDLDRLALQAAARGPFPVHALDLGCGEGVVSCLLARAGATVVAIDRQDYETSVLNRASVCGEATGSVRFVRMVLPRPFAGWLKKQGAPLVVQPANFMDDKRPLEFSLAWGVQNTDVVLKLKIDLALEEARVEIEQILNDFGVPLVACSQCIVQGTLPSFGVIEHARAKVYQERYLKDFDNLTTEVVKDYHRVHAAGQRARCNDCHQMIEHKLLPLHQIHDAVALLSPVRQDCQHCHPNHHSLHQDHHVV